MPDNAPIQPWNDEGYSKTYQIPNSRRVWNQGEIDKFNTEWRDAQRNFGKYLNVDKNGRVIPEGVFGGQKYFKMNVAGQDVFVKPHDPNNPYVLDVKPVGVPLNEGQWTPTEIRPGSAKYAEVFNTLRNTTDPTSGHPMQVDPNNLGDAMSKYNALDLSQKSQAHQAEAREIEARWQSDRQRDQYYQDAERLVAKLGPDKIRELNNWAAQGTYASGGKLNQDQSDFYKLLNDFQQIKMHGGVTGSGVKGESGVSLAGDLVASAIGGGAPFRSVFDPIKDATSAIQSGTFNAFDSAENLERNRLMDKQNAVTAFANAAVDPTLPLNDNVRAEVRKDAREVLENNGVNRGDNPLEKAKSYWDIMKDQGKTPEQQEQKLEQSNVPLRFDPRSNRMVAAKSGQKDTVQGTFDTQTHQGSGAGAGGNNQGTEGVQPKPTPTSAPAQKPADQYPTSVPTIGSPTVPQNKANWGPVGDFFNYLLGKHPAMGGSLVVPPSPSWLKYPGLYNPSPSPTPKPTPTGQGIIANNAEAGSFETKVQPGGESTPGLLSGLPRLHLQEHVDALPAGSPFYWRDHPNAYVRV